MKVDVVYVAFLPCIGAWLVTDPESLYRQAVEEAPLATQGAGVKRKKLSEAVADCNVVVQLQPSPPRAPEEPQVR